MASKTSKKTRKQRSKPATTANGDGLYASFTTRKGNTFYARDYGYKAWPIGRKAK